jgi:hypothetical protein
MYVTERKGGRGAAGENLFEEGFIVMLSYFVNQNGDNKDDFLLVTVRFITVDFFQYVLLIFSCVKSVWNSFICSLPTVDIVIIILFISSLFRHDCVLFSFRFLLTDVLRYTLVRPLL